MKVLLVDDQMLFRKAIAAYLSSYADIKVVGDAENGLQAVEKAKELNPDLILMDISMPECDGLEATKKIKAIMPEVKIIMLTISDEDKDLFEAIKSGAQGYLLKNMHPEDLPAYMQDACEGKAALTPVIATKVLNEFVRLSRKPVEEPSVLELLTIREKEILRMVAGGASNKEIAASLHLTEGTVKNHLHRVLEKLHLRNRAQAAVVALKDGTFRASPVKKLTS